MAGSTNKKAVIQRYQRENLSGYLNPTAFLQPDGVELISAEGYVRTVPYEEIKMISFVREFGQPESTERDVFHTRPKMAGLWVSFRFRDGEQLEGILPNNLLLLEQQGFAVVPPDPYGNRQRIFIPRQAVLGVEVLGVVGSPLKKRKAKPAPKEQIGLFEDG